MATKVAVITGGGRGIGRGIAEELAAAGFEVGINYRSDTNSAEAACRAAEGRGAPKAKAFRADVSDLEVAGRLVADVLETFGQIDIWVNNAGVAPEARRDLLDATPESFDRLIATNLRGPYFVSQAVAKHMVQAVRDGRADDPQIHFISSVSAAMASPDRGDYCVAKAGLGMAAQLFAVRLAGEGVRVFEIRPGIIATDMTAPVRDRYDRRIAEGHVPIRRWGTAADVGRVVASIATGGLPYATGSVIEVDGGLHLRSL